ncbi:MULTISPECIES: type IV secretory system conjugative DNA transfer family protein [unclassified Rathayibacter]|uniref:type IV secretory system conjugative DNA transfer family protein n=1 Tax=unclassified Rathayibacter TaxID=2609250 RepID=UPI000CE7D373|nr:MULTISPECIES: TraM recognition domain-containing protein [unclassified Rathayibacter]PPF69134.1 conjugal transfer protein [Rathayibacter sp. AY1E6]PPG09013.1 conjugal transfer protein [Rathayibacter sp. AY2B1]PPG13237.1 conjugal transfer protein [Rathayibacter sp. AY1C6]PPG50749.1 conjugal transfer protein [Rathayibacter sp. AY2B3]PPG67621.1 conjugal transfer protein [Rathayibacter sp. AY1F4]
MSLTNNRRKEPGKASNGFGVAFAAGGVLIIALTIYIAVRVGSQVDGVNPDMDTDPSNFFSVVVDVFCGRLVWPGTATLIVAGIGAVVVFFGTLFLIAKNGGKKNRTPIDWTARHTATSAEMSHMRGKEAKEKSARLGVTDSFGVPLGDLLSDGRPLYASFEDMVLLLAGPRVGKSTSFVIPAITGAPGSVVTTSNKRDVLDATRDLRAARGQVWVFDPQRVAVEPPSWWWNPLSYVTDDTKAAKLAQHFASGSSEVGARSDAHFEPSGRELLAGFLLAAALDGRPITDVYEWTTKPGDETAGDILASSDFPLMAKSLQGATRLEHRERGSVYSTARRMASCLKDSGTRQWVNRTSENDTRPEFDPAAFVRSTGTLYSLSKEGAGSAGPLVLALTAATVEAAEELAAVSPGGRMQTPMLGVLDEAANVCRWRDLPDLYSHYGSRGIPIMSVFQSWSQGVSVFGKEGMDKLWSAANAKIYAGGISETGFLRMVSELIGTYDRETTSASMNKGVRSTTSALKRELILDVAELANLPTPKKGRKIGRAILMSSGSRAAILRTVPWFDGPKPLVAAINASIANHRPGAAPTPTPPPAPEQGHGFTPVTDS